MAGITLSSSSMTAEFMKEVKPVDHLGEIMRKGGASD
jgi:hypothetical protein